jgi:hypothetical protein
MDPDRIEEMARDPRFIPGIYNYCDRWCERCPFTFRCLNYVMGKEMEAGDCQSRDAENEAFWDRLHETFESTMEMIEEQTEEMDFDLDDVELDDFLEKEENVHDAARSQPYSRTAKRYIDTVDNWFKLNEGFFADKGGEPELVTGNDKPGAGLVDDVTANRDCL